MVDRLKLMDPSLRRLTIEFIYLISDCMYNGQRHADGSVFTAVNDCDFCMCSKGSVTCSNSSGCDQGTVSRIGISIRMLREQFHFFFH